MLNQGFASNNKYEILTPFGWEDFTGVIKNEGANKASIRIQTGSGRFLKLTEDHRLFDQNRNEIRACDIKIGTLLSTESGIEEVVSIEELILEDTYEIFNSESHTILANGFESHQCDEFAFVRPHIQEEFWESIFPTLSTGGSCIISSTPKGDSNLFAELWRKSQLKTEDNIFSSIHVPWDAPPGRDEKFKRQTIAALGERRWKQEYECDFLSSDGSLMDGYVLGTIEKEIEQLKPAFSIDDAGEKLDFYAKINPLSSYIVSVDPATGSGLDYSVIHVYEFPSMFQVAEYRSNLFNSNYVYSKLKKIINFIASTGANVYWSAENNGVGQSIMALHMADQNPPLGVFISEHGKKVPGIVTSARSKIRTCEKMKNMVESRAITLTSATLVKELKGFVRKNGSYAAQTNSTDDCISALLIAIRIIEEMAKFDEDAYSLTYKFQTPEDWQVTNDKVVEIDRGYEIPVSTIKPINI